MTTGKPAEGRILSGFGKQNIDFKILKQATKDFKKAENVCNWIEFIIEANLPFTIVKITN